MAARRLLFSKCRITQPRPSEASRLWHIGLGDNYCAFLRESGNDQLLVVFNSSAAPNNIMLSLDDTALANIRSVKPLLVAAPAALQGQSLQIQGAPVSVAIYEIR